MCKHSACVTEIFRLGISLDRLISEQNDFTLIYKSVFRGTTFDRSTFLCFFNAWSGFYRTSAEPIVLECISSSEYLHAEFASLNIGRVCFYLLSKLTLLAYDYVVRGVAATFNEH